MAQVTQNYDAGPDLHLKTGTQIYVELGKSQGSYRFARADDDDIRGVSTVQERDTDYLQTILKSYVKLLE